MKDTRDTWQVSLEDVRHEKMNKNKYDHVYSRPVLANQNQYSVYMIGCELIYHQIRTGILSSSHEVTILTVNVIK